MFVRPTWAEIHLDNLAHNIQGIHALLPAGTRLMAVVKANAYGHGAIPVARKALQAGATYLAVASVDEALELRKAGIHAPILVLGYTPPGQAALVVEHDLTQTLYQEDMLAALSAAALEAGQLAKVHVKADTGMGRLGFTTVADTTAFVKQAQSTAGVVVEGLFTHFATADEADTSYAEEQLARWRDLLSACAEEGLQIPLQHISNSAGILHLPHSPGNMVRLGISMYGCWPSEEVPHEVELRPVMKLVSQIVHLKDVGPGTKISYGAMFEAQRPTKIATLPIGYADGYSRLLSNRATVLVRGQRARVVGRICMDQLMVDVTDIDDVQTGDEVVLYGAQGSDEITVDEVAGLIGTISYEVICDLGRRVPRLYTEGQEIVEVRTI
ncbi:alanine racemase [Tumebacillus permanentifrigoris]|uniref:Alanine racemase n=1 Tax=Tumebacillus permanentifrigoris TaxID=378543 RepID=A0A316D3R8_9BACL|nr:alanine racemase [Tumebacillus permanentifrigoris]PWK05946.1 alanine racemase [Tumebacillus permanentifrigoris]